MRRPILAVIAATIITMSTGAARADDLPTIRIGWVATPPELQPVLFAMPGVAQHLGVTYRLEPVHFGASPPMIPAMAAGELDVAALTFFSVAAAIQNAGLADLRVFADEFQDGVDGYYSIEFMALKDGPIRTIEDLKGKVLATNGIATSGYMAMKTLLRRHGLEEKKDYSFIEAQLPNMKAMLADKKVDLITVQGLSAFDPAMREVGRTLFTQRDVFGRTQLAMWTARSGFLAKNRPAMVDFMSDVLRAIRWYLDPANHKAAIEIVSQATKIPVERLDGWAFTARDEYRDPNGMPNLDALQRTIDAQRELGFLKADLDIKNYADLSIVEEAAARLK